MTRIQMRRGTAATWTSVNPILAAGEHGFETDTGKEKIGDGATAWVALAYGPGGLVAKGELVVNVKDYGAVGNGVTDDTAAVSAAAAAAAGGRVHFPAGTYVAQSLTLTSNVELYLGPNATLLAKPATGALPIINMTTATTVRILGGGCIDGNKANQTGRPSAILAALPEGSTLDINGIRFTNTIRAAVEVTGFGGVVSIQNCRFTGQAEHTGVLGQFSMILCVTSGQANKKGLVRYNHNIAIADESVITAPSLPGSYPGGLFLASNGYGDHSDGNMSTVEAIGNYFDGYGQNCGGNDIGPIHTYPGWNAMRIIGNFFRRCGFGAIVGKSVTNFVAQGNTIVDGLTDVQNVASEGAISYCPGYHANTPNTPHPRAVITGNIIDNPGGQTSVLKLNGIVAHGTVGSDATDVVIANNVISNAGIAIQCDNIVNMTVQNNIIDGKTGGTAGTETGIRFDHTSGLVQISDNQIRVQNGYGFTATSTVSTGRFRFSNNVFDTTATGYYACILRGAAEAKFTGNTFNAPGGAALNVQGDGTNNVGKFIWDRSNNVLAGSVTLGFSTITESRGHLDYASDPEGLVAAPPGVLYTRNTGGTGTTLYSKETGTGNTGWVPLAASTASTLHKDTPGAGSYTIPATTLRIRVRGAAGGGGGGGAASSGLFQAGGGGGSAGNYTDQTFTGLTIGNTLTVVIGAAGTAGAGGTAGGGAGGAGGTGGSSSVTGTGVSCIGLGGVGGAGAAANSAAAVGGGSGNITSTNSVLVPGGGGYSGNTSAPPSPFGVGGGGGGPSTATLGGGGGGVGSLNARAAAGTSGASGTTAGLVGTAGTGVASGGGGGGGGANGGAGGDGGVGAAGLVEIYWTG